MKYGNSRMKVSFNSPVILTFAILCLISLLLGTVTKGRTTDLFFSVYRSSLASPSTYIRFAGHVLGHANYEHFLGNIMLILVVGPLLEEKCSGAIDISVIDSVAALTPRSEIEGEMGDSKMGLHARLMSQALRKLTSTISKTGCCCIFINQLREKIGVMFGNPETTTGGNALKFYASVRLDIRRISQIKEGDNAVGNRVRVKVVKNKVSPPFRQAEFDLLYGQGISKVGEIIDLGVDLNIVKKSGSWFSYNDTKLGQGRDAVKQLLADNPELSDELEQRVREALRAKDEGGKAPASTEE